VSSTDALELTREALLIATLLCSPVIVSVLIVGFAVSLLQALTQIQEMTLSFVPKMLVAVIVLLVGSSFTGQVLGTFTVRVFEHIQRPTYGTQATGSASSRLSSQR
jgi:flagellar biosynthesis protein FliQ